MRLRLSTRWIFEREAVALMRQHEWLPGEVQKSPEELIRFTDQFLKEHVLGARFRLMEKHLAPPARGRESEVEAPGGAVGCVLP